ncbi:MAG TPA: alpha/beta hydrolase family protein, partial [Gemmataceae bacterium]|nr:alpha/beta hydrolase family protein [Gemmataceae bacterium]
VPLALALVAAPAARAADQDPSRVLPPGQLPDDARLGKPKTLNDYFPMTPPASKEEWEARRRDLRHQALVALGLWPLPERTPLNVVIHGKIDRDGYTIEKVFFASYPGHYVSGNLYRPKGRHGKLPGVLCPHGHWANGRFYQATEQEVQNQLKMGAEKTVEGARYPLQARCAQLARMGCVVFHYDMVGVADSQPIAHRAGFTDADAELRLQSFMGLQTWNSIRSLDFLLGLPDVDPHRIGVTGASGGGTQTFILGAVDDRPTVAFPAVMVSTAMQGGCVCENASYLRQDCGNIDLAGLFAPKPLGMSGAHDWTIDIERKGLPELKALYRLYGAEDKVMAKAFPQFPHNYNQVSREVMYNWFNKHLHLGQPEPVVEKPFVPVPPAQLSVYDAEHPRPKDAAQAPELRKTMAAMSDRQIAALRPHDAAGLTKYRDVIGTALRVMIHDRLPEAGEVEVQEVGDKEERDGAFFRRLLLGRKGKHEQIPAVGMHGKDFDGTVVVWVHPEGKSSLWHNGKLVPAARQILDGKAAILALDVLRTGESKGAKAEPVNAGYAGFTFGYNRPLLAERVHDILTAVAYAHGHEKTRVLHLVGFDAAGPWVLLARALCGDAVARTAADADGFRFDQVKTTGDAMMLPGAVKYGGLPALAGLCAPGELYVHNDRGTGLDSWTQDAYRAAAAADRLERSAEKADGAKVVAWLLR